MKNFLLFSLLLTFTMPFYTQHAYADNASADISITKPDLLKPGDTITIKIKTKHRGNNFLHHVKWVSLTINGKLEKKWTYAATGEGRPPAEEFEIEYKYVMNEDLELEVLANCNLHEHEDKTIKRIKFD